MALLPAAVGATVVTMERQKLRSMVLHWTRPARLRLRGLMARLVYAVRFLKRMPGLAMRLTGVAIRRIVIRPVRWGINRSKTGLHAFLVWRKGEPDQVP